MSKFLNQFDYHDAIKLMHEGHVVKYIGTVNGGIYTEYGSSWCMCRGVIFNYKNGKIEKGSMVYDPDFRYKITNKIIDTRQWPLKK